MHCNFRHRPRTSWELPDRRHRPAFAVSTMIGLGLLTSMGPACSDATPSTSDDATSVDAGDGVSSDGVGSDGVGSDSGSTSAPPTDESGPTTDNDPSNPSGGTYASTSTSGGSEAPGARGIHIDFVEANQGVGVPLVEEGVLIDPAAHLAPVVDSRAMLLRAMWSLEDEQGWEPREIEAQLTLHYDDETVETIATRRTVMGPSSMGLPSRFFAWEIPAERVHPGLRWSLELLEVEDTSSTDPPNVFPEDAGSIAVPVQATAQILKLVLVPIAYDDGGSCVSLADTSESSMQTLWDALYMQLPVNEVQLQIHDPLPWNTPLDSFDELNAYIAGVLRMEDDASPDTYYYGWIDPCAPTLPNGAFGLANGIPTTPGSPDVADQRVASGVASNGYMTLDETIEILIHEVGHTQGRVHVGCGGGPVIDPDYPVAQGLLDTWGYGLLDQTLRAPTLYTDHLSRCFDHWASAYGWRALHPVIRDVSMFDQEGPSPRSPTFDHPETTTLLVANVFPDGHTTWYTTRGALNTTDTATGGVVEYRSPAGVLSRAPTLVRPRPESGSIQLVSVVPSLGSPPAAVTLVDGDRTLNLGSRALEPGRLHRISNSTFSPTAPSRERRP